MRRITLAVLITFFAVGSAAAQSCDSKAVSANKWSWASLLTP